MYTKEVVKHFLNPQNVGKMEDADAEGTIGDPNCGDSLTIYIKVREGVISDISFMVFGCPASIATSSMITVLAKGKTLEEALKITDEDVVDALGGLTLEKQHCSNLGVGALRNAIHSYVNKDRNCV